MNRQARTAATRKWKRIVRAARAEGATVRHVAGVLEYRKYPLYIPPGCRFATLKDVEANGRSFHAVNVVVLGVYQPWLQSC